MFSPRLRLPGILLMGVLGALVLSSTVSQNSANANIVYADLNEGELLQKYLTLCAQPPPVRIEFMQLSSAAERSYLWRVHLGLYLAQHPTLTRNQQTVVVEALLIATPQLFAMAELNESTLRANALNPIADLRRRGLQVFSKSEAAQIFSELGETQDLTILEKYTQLSKLNKGGRNVKFNEASYQEKSDLWRVHLGLSLARHPEWTADQRSIVLEGITIIEPKLYEIPKDKNWTRLVDEPIRLFSHKASLVFSKPERAALFSDLGATESKSHHVQQFSTEQRCNCSREDSYCVYDCLAADCILLTWGCGTFKLYSCDGVCYTPQ